MPSDLIYACLDEAPAIEVRSASERIVSGPLLPIDTPHPIRPGLVEAFTRTTFAHQEKALRRIQLRDQHATSPGSISLGHAVGLEQRDGWYWLDARVAPTTVGDHYLGLLADGALSSWSAGFRSHSTEVRGGVTWHTRATLLESAFVPLPAYDGAAALALREREESARQIRAWRARIA